MSGTPDTLSGLDAPCLAFQRRNTVLQWLKNLLGATESTPKRHELDAQWCAREQEAAVFGRRSLPLPL